MGRLLSATAQSSSDVADRLLIMYVGINVAATTSNVANKIAMVCEFIILLLRLKRKCLHAIENFVIQKNDKFINKDTIYTFERKQKLSFSRFHFHTALIL